MPVKLLISSLLLSAASLAQTPQSPRIITFNRADTDHCKVVVIGGKPLLETTYDGTTVAINLPQNWANGEFSVFVAVVQAGMGEAEINPHEISAVYPDPAHTRFRWFDKAHDLDTELSRRAAGLGQPDGSPAGGSNPIGNSKSADPLPNHPEMMPAPAPDAGTRSEEESRQLQLRNQAGNAPAMPQLDPAHPPVFLRPTTVTPGSRVSGYVFLRRPKGSKVQVNPAAMLDEIDIPVSGVIFRF
jgi:hypothetical protein